MINTISLLLNYVCVCFYLLPNVIVFAIVVVVFFSLLDIFYMDH